ncbi:hypothetical protein V1264_001976 [Littorina saxatilis]|uniref:HAUS augmin-like complex subunit 6 N-terminal domain-containing protein n=2 Tax=Littorina saxatilis TaxID=31220 RepID=A0AAN9C2N0_9CAEN
MDAGSDQDEKGTTGDCMPVGMDMKQIFFTNIQLLGFDATAFAIKYKIPFNKEMFNLPNKAGAETILYFLFNRLDPALCHQEFRDCWPVTDKKTESAFRKVCCYWLQNIQKEDTDAKLLRINAALFMSPGGDKFIHLLFVFSNYVMLHAIRTEHGIKDSVPLGSPTLTAHNKELGSAMETTCLCAAIRHRKHFLENLSHNVLAREEWQSYADEVTRRLRSLTKDVKELERVKRDQVQTAALSGVARGSPIPASRALHNFDMSEHTARRTQRVQQVRSLWKDVEGFTESTQEQQEIVNSIVDKTVNKYVIDAANIKISIPHLMLRECEEEIRRRQVDNIYEGGNLNLVSVLQLWNLALKMYIQRLNKSSLVDLSDPATLMRSQAHTHHAYLANTSALREKMAREIPQRKKIVERLRREFHSEVTQSGLGMTAPSPPVTFDPPRGHSGATPTGPVLQMTPDLTETPEAASNIASTVLRFSQRTKVETYETTAFGIATGQTMNRNSNRLPQPTQNTAMPKPTKQASKSAVGAKGGGPIQPRVVRHVSRQAAYTAPPAQKVPPSSAAKKGPTKSSKPLASTPERVPRSQAVDLDRTPVSSDFNNSSTETPRERAHNVLADKIVWAVMHGEQEGSEHYNLPLEALQRQSSAVSPSAMTSTSTFPSSSLPAPYSSVTTPSQRHAACVNRAQPTALFSDDFRLPSTNSTASQGARPKSSVKSSQKHSASRRYEDSQFDRKSHRHLFAGPKSPVTLIQQARSVDASEDGSQSDVSTVDERDTQRWGIRNGADRGDAEAEDYNVMNPTIALGEDAFTSHDLIHRSPLAQDISRMWQEAVSDSTENQEIQSDQDVTAEWLDTDRSSPIHTLTPPSQRSSDKSDSSASPHLPWQNSSQITQTHRHSHSVSQENTDGHHGNTSKVKEGIKHAWDERKENEQESERTMINNAIAFSTSFDEDPLLDGFTKKEDSFPIWEERLSALYDDQEDVAEEENKENNKETVDEIASFNSALDDLFQSKSPTQNRSKAFVAETPIRDATPSSRQEFPLIAFTPQTPAQVNFNERKQFEQDNANLHPLTAQDGEQVSSDGKNATRNAATNLDNTQTSHAAFQLDRVAQFSPEDNSDKENHDSPTWRNPQESFIQSFNENKASSHFGSSRQCTPSKKVTFSQQESSHSLKSYAAESQEERPWDDDLMSTSGASLLDESFTPLRAGLFVEGKSPARSSMRPSSKDFFLETCSNGKTTSSPDSATAVDSEDLTAQLSRLRKMSADALKNCEEASGVGSGCANADDEEGEDDKSDGDETRLPASSQRPATVGKERELPDRTSAPLDIFGEDDSVLIPASP